MRPIQTLSILGVCTAGIIVLASQSPEKKSQEAIPPSGLSPVESPKEKLDEERLEAAIKGLDVNGSTIKLKAQVTANRAQAVKANQIAETSLNTENTWFKAAGLFRDAILKDPSFAAPYEGLARSVLLEGNTKLAETALRTAVSLDPKFDQARFELGTVIQMRGDYAGSVAEWKKLVDRNPAYPDAYARMSVASYFAQDYKMAYVYLDEAQKRKQNVPSQFPGLLKEVAPRP